MTRQGRTEFTVKLATSNAELRAAQRLRYDVFIEELGGSGELVDHENRLERDRFDPFFDHMILTPKDSDEVIGVYRLLRGAKAEQAGGFYSEGEYDLTVLKNSGRRLLELGRSCLHPDYRGGSAMHCLWGGVAEYVAQHRIEVLFGVASFHGTDIEKLAAPLSLLHERHLAPPELRVRAQDSAFQRMDLVDVDKCDRAAAMVQVPSLIKAYLRLGGTVGEGAFVDRDFNTTDVCLILDTAQMNARQARIYGGSRG
ncbi:GNAT family N-acetyltransferase [Sulfitobacter donghicola]|uniref:L-ornithine N(alpha)-acyltransferase n=1 Tax=Sulfitobacter donghicola DSW-25 = KCTC 12864 = JCM 14565 TaxID=1300350 RepID=A0A073IT56_9RHOB|nr:GNAT family N-acyltransferase [Sulfitobacter donghicola]KEJ88557.1 ornithine-acyl-ACP acyltransferase [Sulfitobacter donghicola DSW-25 = KCTC 12864 = JCM 14565]KIN69555.1 Ornithine-acyl(Acyl carrier protein) N-acyltransferase [Sulfitobacter donghicola DSW-25 = KCTC 12864 = JCM 14565]